MESIENTAVGNKEGGTLVLNTGGLEVSEGKREENLEQQLIEEQELLLLKQKEQREYNHMLLMQAEQQRQNLAAVAGFDQGFNVKTWKSPFVHHSICKQSQKRNVKNSKLQNIEKSSNTANNTSIQFGHSFKV